SMQRTTRSGWATSTPGAWACRRRPVAPSPASTRGSQPTGAPMSAPENSLIGASPLRKEDLPLLTGDARFIADLQRPQMEHAFVVRSYLAHARLVSVDVSAALEVPGVTA